MALTMLYAGAAGETQAQMAQALAYTLPTERLHPAATGIRHTLASKPPHLPSGPELNVVNSLWGQTGHPFRQQFVDAILRDYNAPLRETTFRANPDFAASEINRWVAEETQNRITTIIPQGLLDPSTNLILANAVYFKGTWHEPFNPNDTAADTFSNLDGTTTPVAMMYIKKFYDYYEEEHYQAIRLPFDGGYTAMTVVLPTEGNFAEVEQTLSRDLMDKISENQSVHEVHLYMPRLETSEKLGLTNTLQSMGITDVFSPARADLSLIDGQTCSGSPAECLHVSHIGHTAFVKIDEVGTEAAAATGIFIKSVGGSTYQLPAKVFRMDRPFILLIQDHRTQAVLFTGRITRFTEKAAGPLPEGRPPIPTVTPGAQEQTQTPFCDNILRRQLVFQRGASTAERIQIVISQIQNVRHECPQPCGTPARTTPPRWKTAGPAIPQPGTPSTKTGSKTTPSPTHSTNRTTPAERYGSPPAETGTTTSSYTGLTRKGTNPKTKATAGSLPRTPHCGFRSKQTNSLQPEQCSPDKTTTHEQGDRHDPTRHDRHRPESPRRLPPGLQRRHPHRRRQPRRRRQGSPRADPNPGGAGLLEEPGLQGHRSRTETRPQLQSPHVRSQGQENTPPLRLRGRLMGVPEHHRHVPWSALPLRQRPRLGQRPPHADEYDPPLTGGINRLPGPDKGRPSIMIHSNKGPHTMTEKARFHINLPLDQLDAARDLLAAVGADLNPLTDMINLPDHNRLYGVFTGLDGQYVIDRINNHLEATGSEHRITTPFEQMPPAHRRDLLEFATLHVQWTTDYEPQVEALYTERPATLLQDLSPAPSAVPAA